MIPLEKLRAIKHLVTHANCPDGVASALIIKDALPDVRVSFLKYGSEEHKGIEPAPGVLFCDFSPWLPAPTDLRVSVVDEETGGKYKITDKGVSALREALMLQWRDAGVIVLDHHSRDVVEPYGELGVFGENEKLQCGAWLAYEHVWLPLMVNQEPSMIPSESKRNAVREFAYLAAVRDTWKRDHPQWRTACENAAALLFWPFDVLELDSSEQRKVGVVLFDKQLDLARTAIAESHRFTTKKGTRVLVFQGVSATSDAAELLEKEYEPLQNKATTSDEKFLAPYLQAYRLQQPDLVVGFHYRHETCGGCGGGGDNDPSGAQGDDPLCPQCRGSGGRLMLQFSTRSHTGFDCQALARAHGGNGHKAAAGFTIEQSAEIGANPYAVIRLLLEEWEGGQ